MTVQDRALEIINGLDRRFENEFGNEDPELKERITLFVSDELIRIMQELQFVSIERRYSS